MNELRISNATKNFSRSPDWQRSLGDAVRDSAELLRLLGLKAADIAWIQPGSTEFPVLVPRSFISRMRRGDPKDPLLLQVLPVSGEQVAHPGFTADPLGEQPIAEAGVIEKYPSRTLLITTAACPVHCRYCFRRSFPYASQSAAHRNWGPALKRLGGGEGIREVILSGGDPLSLSNRRLKTLITELEALESLTTLRIHSRFPIVIPERIDSGLMDIFEQTALNVVLVVHCNHANEIDDEVQVSLARLRDSNVTLLNQSVLLKNINDDVNSLESLSYRLFEAGVLPYYLHQLDRVAGAAHFLVEEHDALQIVKALRERLPGYLVPRFVMEVPGALSKTPVTEKHL